MQSDRSENQGIGATPPTLVIGAGRRVEQANASAEKLFRAAPGALLGATMDELVPPERRAELRNIDEVLAGGGARRLRTAIRMADGRRIDVAATLTPCYDVGGRLSAVRIAYEPGGSSLAWLRSSMVPPSLTRPSPASSKRRSAPTTSAGVIVGTLEENLEQLGRQMALLERRIVEPPSVVTLDDPGERARMLLTLAEMKTLLDACRAAARAQAEREEGVVPAAPKLPTF